MYAEVIRCQEEELDRREKSLRGYLSAELFVGDAVLLLTENKPDRGGGRRFLRRTYPQIFRIRKKIGKSTFIVEDLADPGAKLRLRQPVHAERLVKVDLPELDLPDDSRRLLELHQPASDSWERWKIVSFAADGRVKLENQSDARDVCWVDLSRSRYRWVA